jgi:nucleotide-binding universal stress UspA family protein
MASRSKSTRRSAAVPTVSAPRNIVVPYDGSEYALRAAAMAAALARATGGSVRFVTAIEPVGPAGHRRLAPTGRMATAIREMERDARARAKRELERAYAVCRAAGVECTGRVLIGPLLRTVIGACKGADLVVMGSRGLGGLRGLVLGSLSQQMLAATKLPTLIVH